MKKYLVTALALALATSIVSPFTATAEAFSMETGVLEWDFEDGRHISPPPFQGNEEKYWKDTTEGATSDDNIEAGGWTTLQPNVGTDNMPVFPVGIDEVFTRNGKNWGDNGPYIFPNNYYPTRYQYATALPAENKKVFTEEEKAGHGNYVLGAMTYKDQPVRVLGACIKLPDTKLAPGQKYKIELDAYMSYIAEKSEGWGHIIFAGVGAPSIRESAGAAAGTIGNVRDSWNSSTNSYSINGPYEAFDCYNGTNSDAYEKSPHNAAKIGQFNDNEVGKGEEEWAHFEGTFVAKEEAYENGEVILYVGVMDQQSYENETRRVDAGDKLFLDNIKVTPVDDNGNQVVPKDVHTLRAGRIWTFEDESDVMSRDSSNGLPIRELNKWSEIRVSDWNRQLERSSVAEVETLMATKFNGQVGEPIQDSVYCISKRNYNNDKIGGVKVNISRDEFPAGTYTLKATVASGGGTGNGRLLYAAVYEGDFGDGWEEHGSYSGFWKQYAIDAVAYATDSVALQAIGPWWSTISCELEITDSCFDEDGIATIALLESPLWGMTGDPRSGEFYSSTARTYYDDISLTREPEGSELCEGHTLVAKTAVYGTTPKSFFKGAGAYDFLQLGTVNQMYGADSAKIDNLTGIRYDELTLSTAGMDAETAAIFSFFMWDKDMKPMESVRQYGMWIEY